MPGWVRPLATGDVEPVRHDRAVLALPVSNPLKAVAIASAPAVDVQGVAVSAPLLKPALSFGCTGAAASDAGLRVGEGSEEVLALPVHVGAELAREVCWSIRPDTLGEPVFATSMQPGEGPILLVGVDEEVLPPVNLSESPPVEGNCTRIFDM